MAKKTIPQLQLATSVTDNVDLVIDTGSVTKKVKLSTIKNFIRTGEIPKTIVSSSTPAYQINDITDMLVFTTPGAGTETIYLPLGVEGKQVTIKKGGLTAGEIIIAPKVGSGDLTDTAWDLNAIGDSVTFTFHSGIWYSTAMYKQSLTLL